MYMSAAGHLDDAAHEKVAKEPWVLGGQKAVQ